MIVVWGKKHVFPSAGFAASFCPFCRELNEFKVREMREVSHLYYVPLGRGRRVGYRLECTTCGVCLYESEACFRSLSKRKASSLAESIANTNPDLPAAFAERLSLEREIRAGKPPRDGDVRQQLLFEPFECLRVELERGCAETKVDWAGALGCLGTIVLTSLSVVVAGFVAEAIFGRQATDEWILGFVATVGVIGLAFTLWQLHRATRRWLERRMVPHLARALSPLQPTSEELVAVLSAYRSAGLKFAKHLRPSAFASLVPAGVPAPYSSLQPLVPR